MSRTIKGITVEIGGNTTKLNKALKDVNKTLEDTKSELSAVEKGLKLDPSNVTLLKQKQEVLNEAISASKDKLSQLEAVQDQVAAAFKRGEIGEDQYRAFTRVVESSRAQLKNLQSQQQDTNKAINSLPVAKADSLKSALERVKAKLSTIDSKSVVKGLGAGLATVAKEAAKAAAEVAKVAAEAAKIEAKAIGKAADAFGKYVKAATAAGTALAGFSIAAGAGFEEQMSTVAAISGATGEDFEALAAKAKELGRETEFSATQSAQAMEYMAMAGWDTTDILDGLAGVMDLAAASGEDLASVSDIVTDAMTAFGLSAEDSNRFADVLAKTASSANTNVAMMGETFQNVAPLAGAMGYSVEDMSVAIGLMANSGIKAQKAGTALKNIITNLADPSEEVATAMAELGVSLTDAAGNTLPFEEVVNQLRTSFDGLTESQKAQYASTIGGKQGMAGLLAIVNSSQADFAALTQEINTATGAASEMAEVKIDNLSGDVKLLKSNAEGVALAIYDELAPSLREIVQGANDVVGALSSKGLGGALDEAGNFIKKLNEKLVKSLPTVLPDLLKGFNSLILSIVRSLVTMLPTVTQTILPELLISFNQLIQGLVAELPNILPYVIEGAEMLFQGLISGLDEVVVMLVEMLPDLVDQVCSALTDCAPMLLESGLQALVALLNGIADNTEKIVDTVSALIPVFVDTISQNLPKILDAGLRIITELATGILDNLDVILPAVLQLMIAIPAAVIKELPRVLESGKDILGALANGLVETFEPVSSKLSEIIEKIVDFFKGLWDKFKQIGKDIIEGIAAGLEEAADVVTGTFEDFGDNWITGVKDIFGIASPSKVMRDQVGKYMAEGIAVGFEDEMKSVSGAMQSAIPRDFDTDVNIGANISGSASAARSAVSAGGTFGGQQEIVLVLADTAGNVLARSIAGPLDAIQGARVMMAQEGMAI